MMALNSKLFISTWLMLLNDNNELLTRKPKENQKSISACVWYTGDWYPKRVYRDLL